MPFDSNTPFSLSTFMSRQFINKDTKHEFLWILLIPGQKSSTQILLRNDDRRVACSGVFVVFIVAPCHYLFKCLNTTFPDAITLTALACSVLNWI